MASLAPGNGWFPRRTFGSTAPHRSTVVRRQVARPSRHLHAVPQAGRSVSPANAATATGIISKILELLVLESRKAGRAATWILLWGVFGALFALIVWTGFIGTLLGVALSLGVSWTIAAVAVTAAHAVAAILVFLLLLRIGRRLAPASQR